MLNFTLLRHSTDLLFPAACPICREETGIAGTICASCWRDVSFLGPNGCEGCGMPLEWSPDKAGSLCDDCLSYPRNWSQGRAVFSYEGAGRKLILALKHGDRSDLAPILGGWAMRAARDLVDSAEIIAPIPLHWTRRLKRRRNQSADIARWLAGKTGPRAKYLPRLLQRTRQTSSQDGKDRAARVANVQGAMKLARPTDVANKRVLIVDDVMTTGATLNVAARLCRDAGAEDVNILVLALVIHGDRYYMPDLTEDEAHETG